MLTHHRSLVPFQLEEWALVRVSQGLFGCVSAAQRSSPNAVF